MDLINVQESNTSNPLPLLRLLKESGEDFEWYPTTEEILNTVRDSLKSRFGQSYEEKQPCVSVLDCGAGDGRALQWLAGGGDMFAIEKSKRLINEMSSDIFIVGTEFHTNTIIDKKVDAVFCNPPYSEYADWTQKIIREANAQAIYLVIPDRWQNHEGIQEALRAREAKALVIGKFDFLNAERSARARVHIVEIGLAKKRSYHSREAEQEVDPFDLWFDTNFSIVANKVDKNQFQEEKKAKSTLTEEVNKQVVEGKNLIQALVEFYNEEMSLLMKNYQAVGDLNPVILDELGVSVSGLRGALKQKITGCKVKYWNEFFNNYKNLTTRLTSASRKIMLERLSQNVNIDFTESNALAVTAWAVKNANSYFDRQLITMFESLVDQANVTLYKSNERTFGNEEWRYCYSGHIPKCLSHYGLELRIVLSRYSAIEGGNGYSFDFENGLHKDAHIFIEDLLTVAGNLGFDCYSSSRLKEWKSGKKQTFHCHEQEANEQLMEVKAFKNGNLHIKFNQLFIRRLNVEFGRLKGWLKNKKQASEELKIPVNKIGTMFNSNHQISHSSVPQICCGKTVQ